MRRQRIFISYRRTDSSGDAGRLEADLSRRLGNRIFMDVSDIRAGEDFVRTIDDELRSCGAVLAVIGPRWAESFREPRRDPDYVHLELRQSLAHEGVTVIPVLVHGALVPAAADLPDDLRALVNRQAVSLRGDRWEDDVAHLASSLRSILGLSRVPRWLAAVAVASLVAIALAATFLMPEKPGSFDRERAHAATVAAAREAVADCERSSGASGYCPVLFEFPPSGRATSVYYPVGFCDFKLTPFGECVLQGLEDTRIAPYDDLDSVEVELHIEIDRSGAASVSLDPPATPDPRVVVIPRTPDTPVTWPPPDDRMPQAVGRCRATWKSREKTLAADPGNAEVLNAQADCGMTLLEEGRPGAAAPFRDLVDPIVPVLYSALETAQGTRKADLLAHLGWADFLRSRDGVGGLRPDGFYRRAIEQDPDNPHANAWWGHSILWQRGSLEEAQARFRRALASGRDREYVRHMQIRALMLFRDLPLQSEAIRVANEMRIDDEPVPTNDAERRNWADYFDIYYDQLLDPQSSQREAFLSILPPAEHLATFRWLLPESQTPPDKLDLWVLFLATLQESNGEGVAARANYESLRSELLSRRASGRLLDRTEEGLQRLSARQ
jgi:hypothetical protein